MSASRQLAAAAASGGLGRRARSAEQLELLQAANDDASLEPPRQRARAGDGNLGSRGSRYREAFATGVDGAPYTCKLCAMEVRNDDHDGTGNLARHLKRHHRECYTDLGAMKAGESVQRLVADFVARSKTVRSRQLTLDRHLRRIEKKPETVRIEANLMLWATNRGIAFEALEDQLFQRFFQVRALSTMRLR